MGITYTETHKRFEEERIEERRTKTNKQVHNTANYYKICVDGGKSIITRGITYTETYKRFEEERIAKRRTKTNY